MAEVKLCQKICNPDLGGTPLCNRGKTVTPTQVEFQGTAYLNVLHSFHNHKRTIVQSMPPKMKGAFDVMLVTDYPAKQDVFSRLPLQTDAMRVLHEFIEKSRLPQDRIYVTHILKCPGGYIKPSVSEIKTCRDAHLFFEIQLIEPKVIILLGNTALRAFNLHGQGAMNIIHGKVYDLPLPIKDAPKDAPTYKVIPTFHPSYFIQKENKALHTRVVNDFRQAQAILSGTPGQVAYQASYTLCDTVDKVAELADELNASTAFAFDTESTRLGFTTAPALCYSISLGKERNYIVPIYRHNPEAQPWKIKAAWNDADRGKIHDLLAVPFENPNIVKIAHNIKYDVNVLRHWARKSDGKGIRIQGFFADTACFHHLLHEEGPHGLDVCADEEFGYGDYSEPVRNITGQGRELINTFDCVPDELLWPYSATDAEATFRLYEAYMPRLLAAKHLWQLYIEETEPMSRGLAEAEYYGHKLSLPTIMALRAEYDKKQADMLVHIRRQTNPEFNPNSTNDVIQAVINKGFAEKIRDKKKNSGYTVNKKALMDIRDDCSLAGDILDFRSNQKIISTYLENAQNDVDHEDKVRHSWFPLAVTGRLTCSFFHQIPKVDKARVKLGLPILKDMFIADDDCDLVQADYAQIELFILAIVSNDKEMSTILADKTRDLHAETTYDFLKDYIKGYTLELAKDDKYNRAECGKRINFGIGYGSQGSALVKTGKWKDVNGQERSFTWPMLNVGIGIWKKKFHGVADYIDNYPDECRMRDGVALSAFLRERRVQNRLNGADEYVRGEAERECINFKIQSSAGSITNRTIGLVYLTVRGLIDQGIIEEGDIRLVNTVHDSVIYQAKKHLTEWFIKYILLPIGQRPIKELNNHCFGMGVGFGPNWTQAELRETK